MTVRRVVHLPAMRNGEPRVLAGQRNLDRVIRWIHVGEVSNIAALLKGGELLLITGMGIGATVREQREFIARLVERDVAALAVELGQVWRELPAALVDEAEAAGLPLIALGREIPFVEVTEAVHRNIVNQQYAVLQRGDQIHRRFTQLALDGAGIPEIMTVLAATIANPVVLERDSYGIIYHAEHHTPSADITAAWERIQDPSGPPVDGPPTYAVPIPTGGQSTWGRLIALGIDSPIDDFDRVAVERAVSLVALALLRSGQEESLRLRERGNFLADLASDRLSASEAARRARDLGFDHGRGVLQPLSVTVASHAGIVSSLNEGMWSPVWRSLRDVMQSRSVPVLAGATSAGAALILLGLPGEDARTAVVESAVNALRQAAERHVGFRHAVVIAAGETARDFSGVSKPLRETAATAADMRDAPPRPWHDATVPDLERLLWQLRDNPHVQAYAAQRLAPMLEHDEGKATKLLPTLEALCEHGGRKAETARALHLERQTLYYRLQRIERLLGMSVDDADTRLGVHFALRARRTAEGTRDHGEGLLAPPSGSVPRRHV